MAGALVALAGIAALSAADGARAATTSRSATPALVLVVPVVAGVAVGGFGPGWWRWWPASSPTTSSSSRPTAPCVGAAENWVALVVYVVVMLVVARVWSFLQRGPGRGPRREDDTRRLYVLSDLLIGDKPADRAARARGHHHPAGLRAPVGGRAVPDGPTGLRVAATAGRAAVRRGAGRPRPDPGPPQSLRSVGDSDGSQSGSR